MNLFYNDEYATYSNEDSNLTYEKMIESIKKFKELIPEPNVFLIDNNIKEKLFKIFEKKYGSYFFINKKENIHGFKYNRDYFILNEIFSVKNKLFKITNKELKQIFIDRFENEI